MLGECSLPLVSVSQILASVLPGLVVSVLKAAFTVLPSQGWDAPVSFILHPRVLTAISHPL